MASPKVGNTMLKTRVTVGFLFVLVRVISWIGLLVPTKERSTKLHELTRTKPDGPLESLHRLRSWWDFGPFLGKLILCQQEPHT